MARADQLVIIGNNTNIMYYIPTLSIYYSLFLLLFTMLLPLCIITISLMNCRDGFSLATFAISYDTVSHILVDGFVYRFNAVESSDHPPYIAIRYCGIPAEASAVAPPYRSECEVTEGL